MTLKMQEKSNQSIKNTRQTRKKNILKKSQANRLAKKALKNKPKWKPSPGYTYLEDVNIGELVQTSSNCKAILVDKGDASASVIITDTPIEDKGFLGHQRWALKTEVKIR